MTVSSTLTDSGLLIDGRWVPAAGRDTIPVEDPATREVIGRVAVATDADIDSALAAADRAWQTWRETSPHERAAIIMRAATLLRERAEPIARAMTRENGKLYVDSLDEVAYTADIMDSLATEASRRFGHVLPTAAA